MNKEKEFNKLKKENDKLRNSLEGYLPIDKIENERCWELINLLILNEIEQEELCNE